MVGLMNIYNMGLFQIVRTEDLKIQRVPGGWLFCQQTYEGWANTVFVPFDNEFQKGD